MHLSGVALWIVLGGAQLIAFEACLYGGSLLEVPTLFKATSFGASGVVLSLLLRFETGPKWDVPRMEMRRLPFWEGRSALLVQRHGIAS